MAYIDYTVITATDVVFPLWYGSTTSAFNDFRTIIKDLAKEIVSELLCTVEKKQKALLLSKRGWHQRLSPQRSQVIDKRIKIAPKARSNC